VTIHYPEGVQVQTPPQVGLPQGQAGCMHWRWCAVPRRLSEEPGNLSCTRPAWPLQEGTVYDFTFDATSCCWRHWQETAGPATIPEGAAFNDIIVQTVGWVALVAAGWRWPKGWLSAAGTAACRMGTLRAWDWMAL
jgi:hypothetical protein